MMLSETSTRNDSDYKNWRTRKCGPGGIWILRTELLVTAPMMQGASDEFKEQLAKLSLHEAPRTSGIRPELIVYGCERLNSLLLKLLNECRMDKQNIPRAWVDASVISQPDR